MAKRTVWIVAAAAASLLLAACGERQEVIVYKQGKYQGKPDTRPYENPSFGSDKAKWEAAIRQRNLNQNEYGRMGG